MDTIWVACPTVLVMVDRIPPWPAVPAAATGLTTEEVELEEELLEEGAEEAPEAIKAPTLPAALLIKRDQKLKT